MKPKLSIIISSYNYGYYLPHCLDSILKQDYQDYELVLLDDGSTDHSWDILQDYASRYSHIRIFKNETNQGLFKVYERGWKEAKGTYIHFFSADDQYEPDCLPRIMSFLENNPQLGIVCTDLNYFSNTSPSVRTHRCFARCQKPRAFTRLEMIPLFQKTEFSIPGLTCIVKNDLLQKHGYLDPKLENISDWFFFHKIALFEGIGYIPGTHFSMRLHEKTYTSRVKRNKTRRRATYFYLLNHLHNHSNVRTLFQQSGLLSFIFHDLSWKFRLNPRYFGYIRYLKGKKT